MNSSNQNEQILFVDDKKSAYQNMPLRYEEKETPFTMNTLIFGLLGVAGAGLTFVLAKKIYNDFVSDREENRSLDTDSSASIAKRIRMAFDNDGWWGTDEESLRLALRKISSQKQWREVGASYQKLYNRPLMRDMEDVLTSTELAEMMAIIDSKPENEGGQVDSTKQIENWARRLYAAFTIYYGIFPATDEDAVKAVFLEIPTQTAFTKMAAAYQNLYGVKFMDDLKGDMDDWANYMKIITSKPQ